MTSEDVEVIGSTEVEVVDEVAELLETLPEPTKLGDLIRSELQARGWSQAELARQMGDQDKYKGLVSMWARTIVKPTGANWARMKRLFDWDDTTYDLIRKRSPRATTAYTGKNSARARRKRGDIDHVMNGHVAADAVDGGLGAELVPETLGLQVKRARLAIDWSQQDLAHHSEVSIAVVGEIEQGRRMVPPQTLRKVADTLRMEYDVFRPWGYDLAAGIRLDADQLEAHDAMALELGVSGVVVRRPQELKRHRGRRSARQRAIDVYLAKLQVVHAETLQRITAAHSEALGSIPDDARPSPTIATRCLVDALVLVEEGIARASGLFDTQLPSGSANGFDPPPGALAPSSVVSYTTS